jgi:Flp pilus assembly pilin Flp
MAQDGASSYREPHLKYLQSSSSRGVPMQCPFKQFWSDDVGQDIAEYAVMLAVILVIVVTTVRLIGGNANNVFSTVASSITR